MLTVLRWLHIAAVKLKQKQKNLFWCFRFCTHNAFMYMHVA